MTLYDMTVVDVGPVPLPFHHEWTFHNRALPPDVALASPLLDLHRTSDVPAIPVEQIEDAHRVFAIRDALPRGAREADVADDADVAVVQRRIVERFLAGRREHFGPAQCAPLPQAPTWARERRDLFVVVKFMDEAPHLAATLNSLLRQKGIDPGRIVVVCVDNNSTDGSDAIVANAIREYQGPMELVYLKQTTAGAGHAARLGVDRVIATVHAMCLADGDWTRLQNVVIGVSDGDTVYDRHVLRCNARIFAEHSAVDGVMPFLTYKFVAALRLFHGYTAVSVAQLRDGASATQPVEVDVDLTDTAAFDALPRAGRRAVPGGIALTLARGSTVLVSLDAVDHAGRPYGVLRDPNGHRAYIFADRRLILDQAPVSGFDEPLVVLENGDVPRDAKWRWHALIGHDLFLRWTFEGMGCPVEVIFPDTSDALKMFRTWAYAIGGQHQLRRPDLRIATGSDYQSGRVVQVAGGVVRLGPPSAPAETETDRLIKMVRNLVRRQGVFYGETRSAGLERATGLYVHMTRIQGDLETEIRGYDDGVFEHTVFPERVLFPLRWLLQNAVRYFAHRDPAAAVLVRDRVLCLIFGADLAAELERRWLNEDCLTRLRDAEYHDRQDLAERIAEEIIAAHYPALMAFYVETLRSFLTAQGVDKETFGWLLEGVPESRNAITEEQPRMHPSVVWAGDEFQIDIERGQVLRMRQLGRHGE